MNINQRFQAIASYNYNADILNLDFGDASGSAKEINDWIKKATNGKLNEIVSEDSVSKSVLFLINALYFESSWRYPFNQTITADFNHGNGKKSPRQFMEQTGNFYYFRSQHLNAKILRMPYAGRRFSMFIVLPIQTNGLDSVIEKLASDTVKNEVWHMDELETHVVIPKFKFDTSINLNDVARTVSDVLD